MWQRSSSHPGHRSIDSTRRAQAAAALGGLAEAAQYRARVAAIHSALKLHVSRGSTCPARNASREWRSAERVAL